jgi:DNA-binding IclR family transcriptional regulator
LHNHHYLQWQTGVSFDFDCAMRKRLRMSGRQRHNGRLINSLARGLDILRILAQADAPLGVTDLGERLRVDPSTAYRLVATLETQGLVRQEPDSKKYSVGYGVLELANAVLQRLNIVTLAEPLLGEITSVTGESTHVAVLEGPRAVFVARRSGAGILRVETTVGSSEPAYCTAVGKALLLEHTPGELTALFGYEALERYTPQTITTIEDLAAELDRVRRLGYAFDDEEMHPGVRCVAAPIRDHRGRIVASFGLSAPAGRLPREQRKELVEPIVRAAQTISAQLGHQAAAPARPKRGG